MGLAALLTGETDTASKRLSRGTQGYVAKWSCRPVAFEGLRGLGAVAVVGGDAERGARLVGAADTHRYDTPEDPVEVTLNQRFFEPARTRCGTDAWTAAVRDGGALSFGDAIAYALDEPRA